MLLSFFIAFVGFSEGVMVGAALIAFLTMLDIIPRLAQLTNTEGYIKVYEVTIGVTVTCISVGAFLGINIHLGKIMVIIIGSLMGIFVGLLASALTEVTNVIPVIVNRFGLHDYIQYVFIALAGGKVVGAFIYWVVINK